MKSVDVDGFDAVALRLAALADAPSSAEADALRLTALGLCATASVEGPTPRDTTSDELPWRVVTDTVTPRATSSDELPWRILTDAVTTRGAPSPTIAPTIAPLHPPIAATIPPLRRRHHPRRGTRGRAVMRYLAAAAVVLAAFVAPPAEELRAPDELVVPTVEITLERAAFPAPPLESYAAAFETESAFPIVQTGSDVEWVVALRNTGSVGWYRGVDGAQASLKLTDGSVAAVQTTPFVGPGQVGWFVTRFRAPSTPGRHVVNLLPYIDGRGSLPDLGIYTVVTVTG